MPRKGLNTYHLHGPNREVTVGNILVEGLDTIVGVLAHEFGRSRAVDSPEATFLAEVDLDVVKLAFRIEKFKGVSRVGVHVVPVVPERRSAVGECNHELVDRLRALREEVPCHVGVLQVRL